MKQTQADPGSGRKADVERIEVLTNEATAAVIDRLSDSLSDLFRTEPSWSEALLDRIVRAVESAVMSQTCEQLASLQGTLARSVALRERNEEWHERMGAGLTELKTALDRQHERLAQLEQALERVSESLGEQRSLLGQVAETQSTHSEDLRELRQPWYRRKRSET